MTKNKQKILCFSGWGQKFDSLQPIFADQSFSDFEVKYFDYGKYFGFDDFFAQISKNNSIEDLECDYLMGWSLGGQICLKLVEKGLVSPKKLILIAPPFQMVKDKNIKAGMAADVYRQFYEGFKGSPDSTLKKFSILTAMNDRHSSQIAKNLDVSIDNFEQLTIWLEGLSKTSFFDFDFSKIPTTLFFHGKGDMIVHILQMKYFQERIKNFTSRIYSNCGHAPHLSDIDKFRKDLLEFLL